MKWPIIAIIAGVALLGLLLKRFVRPVYKAYPHPYPFRKMIFSSDEKSFFIALQKALGTGYLIFAKIRVRDIIQPKKGESRPVGITRLDSGQDHLFDFLICENESLSIVCAVQLHDKSQASRLKGEDPLHSICNNVGLPLVSFEKNTNYPESEIRARLSKALAKEPLILAESGGRKEPRISNLDDMQF